MRAAGVAPGNGLATFTALAVGISADYSALKTPLAKLDFDAGQRHRKASADFLL